MCAVTMIDAVRILMFPSLMAFAASSDLVTMKISNRISIALICGFLLLSAESGMGIADIGMHALAGAAVLALTFICYLRGWIGGGDAKLAAATALWFGFDHLYDYLLWASLLGGVLTLAIIRFRQLPLPEALSRQAWIVRLHDHEEGVPYGIALAAAALTIYPYTEWMKAAGF
jgi:prepilin peptidase CpaA